MGRIHRHHMHRGGKAPPRGGARALLIALSLAVVATACGSDDTTAEPDEGETTPPTATEAPTTPPAGVESISIGLPGADPFFVQVYGALASGAFERAGVEADIQALGANVVSMAASGQVDLALAAAGAPLTLVSQGVDAKMIYNSVDASGGVYLAALPSVESVSDCTSVGTLPAGSASYGGAVLIQRVEEADFEIVPLQGLQPNLAALLAGRVDCAVNSLSLFQSSIDSGEVHLLVDVRDPAVRENYGLLSFPGAVVFGVADHLQERSEAVTRVIAALDETYREVIQGQSSAEIAELLRTLEDFEAIPLEQIEAAVEAQMGDNVPNDGFIAPDIWDDALAFYQAWGLDFIDPAAAEYSYDSVVDMSYFSAATGQNG